MNRESERKRLVEVMDDLPFSAEYEKYNSSEWAKHFADKLLDDGWTRPPCKVGETVYYVSNNPMNLSVEANTIYEAEVVRIVTTHLCTTLVIQIHNEYGCTEIPNIHEWQKTVFLTREEAEAKLKGGEQK